jgi:hypothetical protein
VSKHAQVAVEDLDLALATKRASRAGTSAVVTVESAGFIWLETNFCQISV